MSCRFCNNKNFFVLTKNNLAHFFLQKFCLFIKRKLKKSNKFLAFGIQEKPFILLKLYLKNQQTKGFTFLFADKIFPFSWTINSCFKFELEVQNVLLFNFVLKESEKWIMFCTFIWISSENTVFLRSYMKERGQKRHLSSNKNLKKQNRLSLSIKHLTF